QRPPHHCYDVDALLGRCQEPRAGYGRERHAYEKLGIILYAETMGEFRPFVVENKLAHAVELEIHRARADQASAALGHEMMRYPARVFLDTAGCFQRVEPIPAHERRPAVEQAVPFVARNFLDRADDSHHYCLGHEIKMLSFRGARENCNR